MKNKAKLFSTLLSLVLFVCAPLHGQNYGNEWIKKDRKYFKVKIAREGLYRIDYTTLATAMFQNGLDLSTIDPRKIQVFSNGEEIPIHLRGEEDGVFNFSDFIEFYGKPIDGTLDRELFYANPNQDPLHNHFTMFNDTAAYFITYLLASEPGIGKRFSIHRTHALGSASVQPFVRFRASMYLRETYYYGHPFIVANTALHFPEYTEGEGWVGGRFGFAPSISSNRTLTLPLPAMFSGGFTPFLEFKVVSASSNIFSPDHHLRVSLGKDANNLTTLYDTMHNSFGVISKRIPFSAALLSGSSQATVRMEALAIPDVALQTYHPSYAFVEYARACNMAGFTQFQGRTEPSASPLQFEWSNYGAPGDNFPLVFDLTNNRRITPVFSAGQQFSYIHPATPSGADIVIFDSLSATQLVQVEPVQFIDFTALQNNVQFIIVTHQSLLSQHTTDYLNYRKTSYAAHLFTVEELYNSFTFGSSHPVAIRRMARFFIDNAVSLFPEYLLLLGRGLQPDLLTSAANRQLNRVPIIGSPASDLMYSMELGGKPRGVPYLATGRVSVDLPAHVGVYLQKLIEQEQSAPAQWKKRVMHLGGGKDGSESSIIRNYLQSYEWRPKAAPFGGSVNGFYRNASDVASELNIRDNSILNINSGTSLITFLGHGSATVLDVDIGDTADYNNKGRLPVMYFNGCRAGNPGLGFNNGNLFYGERMIRAGNKGAIVFIGQSSLSVLQTVGSQINDFYANMFDKNVGKSVSKIMNHMIEDNMNYNSALNRMHNTFIFFQGDPAYALYNPPLPDYFVTPSSLFLDPPNANSLSDSFRLGIVVGNAGRYIPNDSFTISIKRTWPSDAKIEEDQIKVPSFGFQDTFYFTYKTKDIATTGNNKFEVELNADRGVAESNYNNNRTSFTRFIEGNGVSLLYPARYAIHSRPDSVKLVAQSLNLLRVNNQFIIEIDTTPRFNSPWIKRTQPAINAGNIVEWTAPILPNDSQVYYWRGRLNLPTNQGGFWEERSFIFIRNGQNGWSQSHHPQFYPSSENFRMVFDTLKRTFEFGPTERTVWVDTRINAHGGLGVKFAGFLSQDVNPGAGGSFLAVLLDRNTLEQFLMPNHYPKCWRGALWPPFQAEQQNAYYCFGNSAADIADFGKLVNDIPEGTYVALFTRYESNMSTWSPELRQILRSLGTQSFEGYPKNQAAFVMIGKKGAAPGTMFEMISHLTDSATFGYAAIEGKIFGKHNQGYLISERIGPAATWGTAFFDWRKTEEVPNSDELLFSIYGQDTAGNDFILRQNIQAGAVDLSWINPQQYPFLKLRADFKDITDRSAPQLRHWLVSYDDRPEGTINTSIQFTFHNDTLQEGDSFRLNIGFQNISSKPMDSVFYKVEIQNLANQAKVYSFSTFGKPIAPTELVFLNTAFSTEGLKGRFAVNIAFNPGMLQPERSLSNNFVSIPFVILNDHLNPLLDVTFDGRHIMNGEIVSPSPLILISSKDENKFLLQKDTSGFDLFLRKPGSQVFEPIDKATSEVVFRPAATTANVASLEYKPESLPDGKYTLRVQARDASGNEAGKTAYSIDFQVINESTVTNFYPYPNPFTTSMRFVFTLTGAEIPDDIRVQIMTVSGKVVREISKDELGVIRSGNNISDFAWDGTDQFGDRLANGVYLYRVIVRNKGEELKRRESKGDNSFVKDVGKIYLLR